MICPHCLSEICRRSRRRSVFDYLLGLSKVRPWRCLKCLTRFYAWKVPVSFALYALCPRCGNLDLERVLRESVTEGFFLSRLLGLPAYRCNLCGISFFSLKPYHPVHAAPPDRVPTS